MPSATDAAPAKVRVKLRAQGDTKKSDLFTRAERFAREGGSGHEQMALARELLSLVGIHFVSYELGSRSHQGSRIKILCEVGGGPVPSAHVFERDNRAALRSLEKFRDAVESSGLTREVLRRGYERMSAGGAL